MRLFLVLLAFFASHALRADTGSIGLNATDVVSHFAQAASYRVEPASGWSATRAWSETRNAPAYPHAVVNLGRQDSPVWLRFTVRNELDRDAAWILMTMRMSLAVLEIYAVNDAGPRLLFDYADDTQRVAALRDHFGLASRFELAAGESQDILIRFQAVSSGWLPMLLVPQERATGVLLDRLTVAIFSAAAVLALAAINLLYFVFTRQPIFAWYCLSTVFALFAAAHMSGLTTILLFAEDPASGRVFGAMVIAAAALFMSIFAVGFLRPERHWRSPWFVLHAAIVSFGSLYIFLLGAASVLDADVDGATLTGWFIYAFAYVVLPLHALRAVLQGNKAAWPLVIGWLLYGMYSAVMVLSSMGVIAPFASHWLMLGPLILVETALMAVALALQVRAKELERARFRQEKEQALEELANNARLVLAVGHDGRNMLAGIEHLGHELADADSLDEVKRSAGKVQSLAATLNDTLSILINESRTGLLENGAEAIEMVSVDEIFRTIALLFERRLAENKLRLTLRASGERLAADRAILVRTLANLVDNAIKYGCGERILVTYRCRETAHEFQVWNQGAGIEQTQLDEVLADNGSLARYQAHVPGEGVGLAICRELVGKAGGQLHARSRPGGATMVGFTLPHPDVASLQEWSVEVAGHETCGQQLRKLLERLPNLRGRGGRTLQLLIPDADAYVAADRGKVVQRTVIATFDRSLEFRRCWQTAASSFLYLPAEPESLVCALNSAVRA